MDFGTFRVGPQRCPSYVTKLLLKTNQMSPLRPLSMTAGPSFMRAGGFASSTLHHLPESRYLKRGTPRPERTHILPSLSSYICSGDGRDVESVVWPSAAHLSAASSYAQTYPQISASQKICLVAWNIISAGPINLSAVVSFGMILAIRWPPIEVALKRFRSCAVCDRDDTDSASIMAQTKTLSPPLYKPESSGGTSAPQLDCANHPKSTSPAQKI